MEEALRAYFIAGGFYVLRGVRVRYHGGDVTDIDIWLYARTSPVSRHRVIVDAKNKKQPQAMERIFWAQGLQKVLGLDQAIVATTDKRDVVRDFGREHGVIVLDGSFILRLIKSQESSRDRISEEDFERLIDGYSLAKVSGDWKNRLRDSKALVTTLDYNAVNHWLSDARFFLDQCFLMEKHRPMVMRLFYFTVSLFAIGIDYVLKELSFDDVAQRKRIIDDGLRHGTDRAAGVQRMLDVASGLAEQYLPDGKAAAHRIREGIKRDFADLRTSILAEYFSRASAAQSLFQAARELEAAAYRIVDIRPAQLSVGTQSLIGVLLDYWHIDRTRFFAMYGASANSEDEGATDGQPRTLSSAEPAQLALEGTEESI